MATKTTTTSVSLLDLADDLHKSTMQVLAAGLNQPQDARDKRLFREHVLALVVETRCLLMRLERSHRARARLLCFQWAVFSMTVGSGCFLLLKTDSSDDELLHFVKVLKRCVQAVAVLVSQDRSLDRKSVV
jgi:hypothetical protein